MDNLILTPDIFKKFICSLPDSFEVLKFELIIKKLQNKEKIRIYTGFEPSGNLHIGHVPIIEILLFFQKYSNCELFFLIADMHGTLNNKPNIDENFSKIYNNVFKVFKGKTKIIRGFKKEKGIFDGFQSTKEYFKEFLNLSKVITINRNKRAMTKQKKLNIKDPIYISEILYNILQITDIKFLRIDLALGGMDQRKIHMLGYDTFNKLNINKFCCIHSPLLLNKGLKISKSLKNFIPLGSNILKFKEYLESLNISTLNTFLESLSLSIFKYNDCKKEVIIKILLVLKKYN